MPKTVRNTHCSKGHPLSGDNLYARVVTRTLPSGRVSTTTDNYCKICVRTRNRKSYALHHKKPRKAVKIKLPQKRGPKPKPFCGKGHPMKGNNLYFPPRGGRQCRTCRDGHPQIKKPSDMEQIRASILRIYENTTRP